MIVDDIDFTRLKLPCSTMFKVKTSTIFKLLKDIIGKDLSRFSMPVWVNEPMSIS